MKYKSIMVVKRGGVEGMRIVEQDLRAPAAGEVRIRVLASSVGRTDIHYRYGRSPVSPKLPFIPGYQMIGEVDAVGTVDSNFSIGERVAALTGTGGNAEIIYLAEEHLVSVPATLALDEAVVLILNYVTAYQILHRVAKVKAGDKVLLIGASGGVGTALLQLGKLAEIFGENQFFLLWLIRKKRRTCQVFEVLSPL